MKDTHPKPPPDAGNETSSFNSLQDLNTTTKPLLIPIDSSANSTPEAIPGNTSDFDSSALKIEPITDLIGADFGQPVRCPSCPVKEVADYFCEPKKFVIVVRVDDNGVILSQTNQTYYQVQVERVLKQIESLELTLDRMLLYTDIPMNSSCTLELVRNQTYLVTGEIVNRNAVTSVCDLILDWSKIAPAKQKIFDEFFAKKNDCPNSVSTEISAIYNVTLPAISGNKTYS